MTGRPDVLRRTPQLKLPLRCILHCVTAPRSTFIMQTGRSNRIRQIFRSFEQTGVRFFSETQAHCRRRVQPSDRTSITTPGNVLRIRATHAQSEQP
jgi:hypothetical protein